MKRYRSTFIIIIIGIILLGSIPLAMFSFGFKLPPQYDLTFFSGLNLKVERLKKTTQKRIVVIGGSSVAFGLRSDLIELNFDKYEVVNFGLYASLGTKVMLDISKHYIRSGDIVIISPEQHNQTLSLYFNNLDMWKAIDGHFEILDDIDESNVESMWGTFPYFASEKLNYYLSKEKPNPQGVYNVASFNNYGDIEYASRNYNSMFLGFDQNNMVSFDPTVVDDDFLNYLNNYYQLMQKRNVKVFYHFCPINRKSILKEELSKVDSFYSYLNSKLKFEILGNPHKSILDYEWFYDTNFHLNSSGAIYNTLEWIKDLKVVFNDNTPIFGSVPEKPEIPNIEDNYEDNVDNLDCFTYQENEEDVTIIGLTDLGREKSSLAIPTIYKNKKIRSFSKNVFANNSKIKEITIYPNIKFIDDYSFASSTLEKIFLMNNFPSACQVGGSLLEGCNASIYVPQEVVDDYKLHYIWAQYANRILPIPY